MSLPVEHTLCNAHDPRSVAHSGIQRIIFIFQRFWELRAWSQVPAGEWQSQEWNPYLCWLGSLPAPQYFCQVITGLTPTALFHDVTLTDWPICQTNKQTNKITFRVFSLGVKNRIQILISQTFSHTNKIYTDSLKSPLNRKAIRQPFQVQILPQRLLR